MPGKVFLDETSTGIGRPSKSDCSSHVGGPHPIRGKLEFGKEKKKKKRLSKWKFALSA